MRRALIGILFLSGLAYAMGQGFTLKNPNFVASLLNPAAGGGGPPTFFGYATSPSDPGSQTGTGGPYAITPPSSMVAGDLVVVGTFDRNVGAISISEQGGQTWTTETGFGTTFAMTFFWCEYDGTWDANPSWATTGTTEAFTIVMLVFRAGNASLAWSVDVNETQTAFSAPSTPFDVTVSGITTVTDNAVAVWFVAAIDDNTWSRQSGATEAFSQVRNSAGGDTSITALYTIKTTAGATGDSVTRQATLGGDQGKFYSIAFKEQ